LCPKVTSISGWILQRRQQRARGWTGTVNGVRFIDSSAEPALDDDQIETAICVKYTNMPALISDASMDWAEPMPDGSAQLPSSETAATHCTVHPEALACCRQSQSLEDAIVDCAACLEQSWLALKASFSNEELTLAEQLLAGVRSRGKAGYSKSALKVSISRK
jgi:hypothetical protein